MIPETAQAAAIIAGALLVVAFVIVIALKSLIIIVPPNAAAVVTGRKRQLTDGTKVGYRTVIGGRTLRIPIFEGVQYLSLETFPLELTVNNAFSKGNIPLDIEAIANVKMASEPESVFNNGVERLLGKTENEIRAIARDTLMGNLRGVLATLTPEQVNEDRLGFAKALTEDAGEDLSALGLRLDVLKIQNVSDQRGYLAAIGRKKTAEAVRDAEMAEAQAAAETRRAQAEALRDAEIAEANAQADMRQAKASAQREAEVAEVQAESLTREAQAAAEQEAEIAEANAKGATREAQAQAEEQARIAEAQAGARTRQAQADAKQSAEVKEAGADILIAEANNTLRVREAELAEEAEKAEKTAKVRAEQAEVLAQRALEEERVEKEKIRLQADVVAPATAQREAAIAEAQGDAAPILEEGKARAEAFHLLFQEVKGGGPDAVAVFLADKLPELLDISVEAVSGIDIERLIVMDGGEGQGVSKAANQRLQSAFGTIESLTAAIGIDIQGVLAAAAARQLGTGSNGASEPATEEAVAAGADTSDAQGVVVNPDGTVVDRD
jgi:flotillin